MTAAEITARLVARGVPEAEAKKMTRARRGQMSVFAAPSRYRVRPGRGGRDIALGYALGLTIDELRVVDAEPFMTHNEFATAVRDQRSVYVVAEDRRAFDRFVGFALARVDDADAPGQNSACLVYLAVVSDCRRNGVGHILLTACVAELRTRGVRRLYGWAKSEITTWLGARGFRIGRTHVWCERDIFGGPIR